MKRGGFVGIILVVLLLLLSLAAHLSGQAAQKQAAKPAQKAGPQYLEPPQPFIAYVFPAGGQRGQTVEIDASGTNLVSIDKPKENAVRVTGEGVTARVIEAKEPNKARVAVAIAPNADLGEREIRFLNPGGISNRFRFFVGQLPEIKEVEPNSEKDKPQRIASLPVVVNGQVMESDRDYFRFSAKAGQTIVFAVQARRILPYIADAVPGWFDACLALYDSNGKELKYADDFRFNPDPLMFFNVPRDGEYTLEIRDIIYRGRGDFVYRLTIGELPYLTHIFPLGGAPNSETPVELYGVNLPAPRLNFRMAPDAPRVNYVSVTRNGVISNSLPFAAGHYREVREAEPNDSLERAQRAEPPCVINGRIQKPGDADYFAFSAPKAGQRLVFEVQARRLDSPLDSIITLFNPRGDPAAENDDWVDPLEPLITHHADSRLVFTFPSSGPAAGQYVIRLRDAQGNGGEEYAYRLIIAPPQPDFVLRITPDNFRVGQGDTTGVTITAVKLDGFDGEIDLSSQGLPKGFVTSEARIPAGQTEARLTLTAPPDAEIGVLSPGIVGKAGIDNATVTRKAVATELVMQAFAWTYNVPARQLFLAVLHPTAYKLSAEVPSKVLEIPQESEVPIVVKVLRKEGVKGGVSLSAPRPANGITVKAAFVAPDKDEGTLTVSVAKDAPVGLRQNIMISGAMRTGRETITRFLPAIPIKVVAAQQAAAKQ
jgi:hypothetical protein